MTLDEYARLLAHIAGDPIGLTARLQRESVEREVGAAHAATFWIFPALGDAVHHFYLQTLVSVRPNFEVMGKTEEAMLSWHLACFNRFAAAYRCGLHGYYFETMALSRDLWEVALSIAALKRQIVRSANYSQRTRKRPERWKR